MTLNYALMIIFYWFFLTGVVFLSGSFISKSRVTTPSGAEFCLPSGRKRCLGETASRYILFVSLFAFLVNAAHLFFHAAIMTETPLNEVFSIITPFLTKTKYGRFTLLRTAFISALIVVSLISIMRETKWTRTSGVVFSLALLVVISMSGHQGVKGYTNIPFFLDVIHLIAISTWIGGLFLLRSCFSFLIKEAGLELLDTFRSMIMRFSDLATYCVYVTIITGTLLSLFNIKGWSVLTQTNYGVVLIVKLILVGILLALGGINKFFIVPTLGVSSEQDWTEVSVVRKRLYQLVSLEAYIGLAVLLATSLLTHFSPEG
jgi:putative copper resistance protein D